jgi:hypothetical protein
MRPLTLRSWCLAAILTSGASAQPCGNPWTVHPGPGPSAREAAAIAYDSDRGKVVLFGGRAGSSTIFGDTWEWTAAGPAGGGSWTQIQVAGPPTTATAAMAYDSVRHRTVMFGGYTTFNTSGPTNATWEWDGATWMLMQPVQSPPAMSPVMAFDPVRGRTVLVSTIFSGPESQTTWEYDGTTWTRSNESTPVVDWFYDSMAFDAARSVMVMYNGGLWERSASGWQPVPNSSRISSNSHRIIYDGGSARIAFINDNSYTPLSAVWLWNLPASAWSVMNTGGPPATRLHAAAYDAAGQQILVFGGGPLSGPLINETRLVRTNVTSGPIITSPGPGYLGLGYQGSPGAFMVSATGSGPLAYQWRRAGVNISDGTSYSGTQTAQLTITPHTIALAGSYDVVVTDSCGATVGPRNFLMVSCYPDCDGVGGLTGSDFICFLSTFNNGCTSPESCYPNCDGSTTSPFLTANDFMCYLSRYVQGCS